MDTLYIRHPPYIVVVKDIIDLIDKYDVLHIVEILEIGHKQDIPDMVRIVDII